MPGITKWIDVQVQKQSIVTDFVNDDAVCSTNVSETSNNLVTHEQCAKQSVPQHPCISAEQATLQHNGDPHCLSMVVPNENMIIDEQCDFADGLYNREELSKVPLILELGNTATSVQKGNSNWTCRTSQYSGTW